jgi:formate/nitrite transporter FocA (FNT family)
MTPSRHDDLDESKKSYRTILIQQIQEELGELDRPAPGLLLSGLSAGLDIGFSVLLMAVMLTLVEGIFSEPVVRILLANMYTVGYMFVILGRSELFTEHTTLAVLPVLNGSASLRALGRLWILVYATNLLGAAIFAGLVTLIGPALGIIKPEAFGTITRVLDEHPWWVILLSGVLTGWLMGLLGWLVAASRDTISQVFFVWLVTFAIGFSHLHHSITGSVEVLVGIFAGQGYSLADFAHFLLWTTLGNIIGGVFFVALIKYSHAVQAAKKPKTVKLAEPAAPEFDLSPTGPPPIQRR